MTARMSTPLWTSAEAAATGGQVASRLDRHGHFHRQPHRGRGRSLRRALRGAGRARFRGRCTGEGRRGRAGLPQSRGCRPRAASDRSGRAGGAGRSGPRRARADRGQGGRRHGFGRQDHGQGDAAHDARGAGPHPCRRGELQQPLGRAGDAGADAHRHRLRHHRDRHERPRRDRAAGAYGQAGRRRGDHRRARASGGLRRDRGDRPGKGVDLRGAVPRRRRAGACGRRHRADPLRQGAGRGRAAHRVRGGGGRRPSA
jgi:hypothetical protein